MLNKVSFYIFISFFIVVFLVWPAISFSDSKATVVINEIYVNAYNESGSEYIKLYNLTESIVDISGWQIKTDVNSIGNIDATFPEGTVISPKGFFLLADKDWENKKDNPSWPKADYMETINLYNSNAGISLLNNVGKVIDAVGYGDPKKIKGGYERQPIDGKLIIKGVRIRRRSDGKDTDNNANDFIIVDNQENTQENAGGNFDGVYLSEIMPNPASPASDSRDEWIELKNSSGKKVDLSGAILRDGIGSVHEYIIPDGISIDPGRFAIFYSSATHISLNNSGDFVEFLDRDGKLIDSTGGNYGKAKAEYSYVFKNDKWQWTKTPTPLGDNVVANDKDGEESIKDTSTVQKTSKSGDKKNNDKKNDTKDVKGASFKASGLYGGDDTSKAEKSKYLSNKALGISLIFLAGLGAINYIIFREKIYEIFKQRN